MNRALKITYTNWRGETAERSVLPVELYWGSNEWHPTPQWLLVAVDLERGVSRTFAMRNIKEIK